MINLYNKLERHPKTYPATYRYLYFEPSIFQNLMKDMDYEIVGLCRFHHVMITRDDYYITKEKRRLINVFQLNFFIESDEYFHNTLTIIISHDEIYTQSNSMNYNFGCKIIPKYETASLV
jgi:hypothetical protein